MSNKNKETISRMEVLQETHRDIDRQCTDLEKKLAGGLSNENHNLLVELKKKKLLIKDQIEALRKQVDISY